MSFGKDVQKIAGFDEYASALVVYKRACSVYKKTLLRLAGLQDTASRFERFEAKEEFSRQCKIYAAARQVYAVAAAEQKLAAKGVDVNILELAKLAHIEIPLSQKALIREVRTNAMAESMSNEQFEAIKKAALTHDAEKLESFLEDDSF